MNLLHVDSSILGAYSASRQLTAEIVAEWRKSRPDTTVEYLDVAANPIGPFGADAIAIKGIAQPEPTDAQRAENALSEKLVSQFLAADVIVIGAPFYNFSIPTQLKAWIDRLAQPGRTFTYKETGPVGLATSKTVVAPIRRAKAARPWNTRRATSRWSLVSSASPMCVLFAQKVCRWVMPPRLPP